MLLTFSFKNFGPYLEESSIDFRAVEAYSEHEYNLREYGPKGKRLLKVAMVQGANASGKSQLVRAYHSFARIVGHSFGGRSGASSEETVVPGWRSVLRESHLPYLFAPNATDTPTEFEAVYVADEGSYQYGFAYTSERILSEWLYFTKAATGRPTTILERDGDDLRLGATVRGECAKYVGEIAPDVLALSFFSALNLKLKSAVFARVARCVASCTVLSVDEMSDAANKISDLVFGLGFSQESKDSLLAFLRYVDLGIKDFSVEHGAGGTVVRAVHVGPDGLEYRAPIEVESSGTKKMILLAALIHGALKADRLLVVDELDASLHPLLLHYIVSLFHDERAKGQLLFTTHDLSLLDRRYMRRDEIWFTAKDEFGRASLRSLADFGVRKDADYRAAYLGGSFDSIPVVSGYEWGDADGD